MPISPLYEWTETDATLEVNVQLQGATKTKPDVFATECMLKINSPPYLLLIDLFGCVDDSKSVVTIMTDAVIFRLVKKPHGIWGQLQPSADKEEVLKRRNESIDRAHAKLEEARKLRLERKQKEEREATDRQIELERKKRLEIEDRKKRELEQERSKLVDWKKGMDGGQAAADADAESDYESDKEEEVKEKMPDHPDYYGKGWQSKQAETTRQLGTSTRDDEEEEDDQEIPSIRGETMRHDSEDEIEASLPAGVQTFRPLPPPRIRLQPVQVEFTKLETGHLPAREHREEEIRIYKKTLKTESQLADSVDVADRQPVFLKDKGDALYKQGNFRGAINAYARALELDPDSNPAVWSNAAACFMQLGEHEQCVNNCTRALKLLEARKPRMESGAMEPAEVDALRRQLVRVLVRRAQARAALGMLPEAESDYVEALRCDASNMALTADLEELRAAMQPADASALKQRGNARFQAKNYEGAAEAFTLLLGMPQHSAPDTERLAALSNRAACHLVMEKYEAAIADCSAALAMHLAAIQEVQEQQRGEGKQQEHGQQQQQGEDQQGHAQQQQQQQQQLGHDQQQREGLSEGRSDAGVSSLTHVSCLEPIGSSPDELHLFLSQLQTWPCDTARAAAACRVAARRAAAYAHAKRFAESALDYMSAAALAGLGGDEARQQQLQEDAERCRGLLSANGASAPTS